MKAMAGYRWIVLAFLVVPSLISSVPNTDAAQLYRDAAARVLPAGGYQSTVALGDSIIRLAQAGVIDRKKLEAPPLCNVILSPVAILIAASSRSTLVRLTRWNLHHKDWVRLVLGSGVVAMGLLILATV